MTPLFVNLTNHRRVNQGTKGGRACNRIQARVPLSEQLCPFVKGRKQCFFT